MRIKFQADADFTHPVVAAIQRRWPSIDIRGAPRVIPNGLPDEEVLAVAAAENRVLLSHDVTTMPRHFLEFILASDSPGLILVPQGWSVQLMMDGIYALWSGRTPAQLRNQMEWMERMW